MPSVASLPGEACLRRCGEIATAVYRAGGLLSPYGIGFTDCKSRLGGAEGVARIPRQGWSCAYRIGFSSFLFFSHTAGCATTPSWTVGSRTRIRSRSPWVYGFGRLSHVGFCAIAARCWRSWSVLRSCYCCISRCPPEGGITPCRWW